MCVCVFVVVEVLSTEYRVVVGSRLVGCEWEWRRNRNRNGNGNGNGRNGKQEEGQHEDPAAQEGRSPWYIKKAMAGSRSGEVCEDQNVLRT